MCPLNSAGIFWRLILVLGTDTFNKLIDISKRDRDDVQIKCKYLEREFGE